MFIHTIQAGSSLFYYDIKNDGGKNSYVKCWFSFNSLNFGEDIEKLVKLNIFNPVGSQGMIVWLYSSALNIHTFTSNGKKQMGDTIKYCTSYPVKSYKDAVGFYIESMLPKYYDGTLDVTEKNKLIELAKQINFTIPAVLKLEPV